MERMTDLNDLEQFLSDFIARFYDDSVKREGRSSFPGLSKVARASRDAEVKLSVEVNRQLDRQLVGHRHVLYNVAPAMTQGADLRVSFGEKYTLTYEVSEVGAPVVRYETKGFRDHFAVLSRNRRGEWAIGEYFSKDFSTLPTPNVEAGPRPKAGGKAGRARGRTANWEWDGLAAAGYSNEWALHNNPDYRTYDNDCTNFASQCLKFGGKTYRGGERTDSRFWFYGSLQATTSYSWAGAHNLATHMKTYTNSTVAQTVSDLRVGDLVFADWGGETPGTYDHTMVVGAKSKTDALMNYHSNNIHLRSLTEIMADSPKGSQFLMLKVGTSYK